MMHSYLSAAMAKRRDGMRQHLAKQMHVRTAHPPPHALDVRRQLQDAPVTDMSMQAAPVSTTQ
jgi:hypothetical protein